MSPNASTSDGANGEKWDLAAIRRNRCERPLWSEHDTQPYSGYAKMQIGAEAKPGPARPNQLRHRKTSIAISTNGDDGVLSFLRPVRRNNHI
jgi:hypothetical protein